MSSSTQLTVLCPNGRRQQVRVQPNTKLLEVLEEVCKKQGLESNQHDLIHHKKPVDVSLPFRLSGVANNAQLELKQSENSSSRRGGEQQVVVISLQLDDGSRLEPSQFKPETTLYQVVQLFAQKQANLSEKLEDDQQYGYPCVSYLNDQVIGLYQIKNTTLKDLGLTGGRSVVRFGARKIETSILSQLDAEFRAKLEKRQKLDEIFESKRREELARLKSQSETLPTLPKEEKKPSTTQSEIAQEPTTTTTRQEEKKPKIEFMDYDIVKRSETTASTSQAVIGKPLNPEFVNFKFPQETKGQDLNNVNELAEIERESKRACDRQACLIQQVSQDNKEAVSSSEKGVDDEEFYEVTRDDLVNMLKDLRRAQNTSEESMLMTRQMRELEQDRKAMRYSQIVIRVAFGSASDLLLQGFFRPKEPISALYSFVRESINIDDDGFHLFVTPPRVVLPDDTKSTLFDFKLYPAAIVHYKSNNKSVVEFKSNLSENVKSMNEADELVHENVHKQIRHVNDEGMRLLQREQSQQAQSIARVSGLIQNNQSSTIRGNEHYNSAAASSSTSDQPPRSSNDKLLRFLKGGSKK